MSRNCGGWRMGWLRICVGEQIIPHVGTVLASPWRDPLRRLNSLLSTTHNHQAERTGFNRSITTMITFIRCLIEIHESCSFDEHFLSRTFSLADKRGGLLLVRIELVELLLVFSISPVCTALLLSIFVPYMFIKSIKGHPLSSGKELLFVLFTGQFL